MRIISHLVLALSLLAWPGGDAGAELSSPDLKRIKSRGKLRVAMYGIDIPPFFMHSRKGEFFGFDVDLARDIARNLGVEVTFERTAGSFNQVVKVIEDRRADIAISKLSMTPARAERVVFSDIYTKLDQVLLINRLQHARLKGRGSAIERLNQSAVKVGVAAGTSFVGFARRDFEQSQIVEYKERNDAFADVLGGKLHAILFDNTTVQNWFHTRPDAGIEVRTLLRKNRIDPLAMAVHAKDQHLLKWINSYLKLSELDGTLERLRERYLTDDGWRKRTRTKK